MSLISVPITHAQAAGLDHQTNISIDSDSEEGGMQLDVSADRDLYFAEGDSDMDDLDERDGFSMEEDRDGE